MTGFVSNLSRQTATARSGPDSPRLLELDGLRAFAIFLVMLLHHGLIGFGWIGVQVFFVLSGFLISGILLRTKDASTREYFGRFYWNRALRILPVYFLFLALIAVIHVATGDIGAFRRYWAYLVTFTFNFERLDPAFRSHQAITPLWSLAVEEQFYLIWPLVLFLLDRRRIQQLSIALIVLGPALRYGLMLVLQDGQRSAEAIADMVYWLPFSHVDAFSCGTLVALWHERQQSGQPARPWERWLNVGALAMVAVAGVVNLAANLSSAHGSRLPVLVSAGYPLAGAANLQPVWCYTLLNAAAATTLLLLLRADGLPRLADLLRRRWLVLVGQVSYGMYLCHWLVSYTILQRAGSGYLVKLLTLIPFSVLVFGLAFVSFHVIERRFLALRISGPARLRTEGR